MANNKSRPESATQTEFRADRSALAVFVGQGKQYVHNMESVQERLRATRSMAAYLLGVGVGPVDLATRALQELTAEARINNAFVAQVSDSLESFNGSVPQPDVVNARIDRDLEAARLGLDGIDRSLERDSASIGRFQAAQLVEAGLNSSVAGQLIGRPRAVDAALTVLGLGVHPEAVSGRDLDRLLAVADLVERGLAVWFDAEQLEALLERAYAPDLDRQVLATVLEPPTNAVREQVVAAMVAGRSPKDAGLAPAYFPARYRRFLDIEREIADAEVRREVADGSSWSWWDSDDAALALVDEELRELRDERDALIDLYQIRDAGVARFAALAATSDTTAGYRWEGEAYADHFIGYHDSKISDGSWFLGAGEGLIEDPDGNDVEFQHIGRRLTVDPWSAAAFYNRIGVERTSDLATFLAGNDLDVETFNQYGAALGAASRATAVSGSPVLAFSGSELIRHPKSETHDGVIWYNPALLFVEGEFDPGFLVEATSAALAMADDGNDQGIRSHLGSQYIGGVGGGTIVTFEGGEDPRNILLSRVAEDLSAVKVLITSLGGPRGHGWSGRPSAGTLDSILQPEVPFGPTIGSNPETYWLDALRDLGNVADPDHANVAPVAYPDLSSRYPITSLLGAVAAEPTLSRWVLLYTAAAVADRDSMVQDTGTAAGLDLIMAGHATLMFEPADLVVVGIEPSTINNDAAIAVRAADWRSVHGEVLRYGRGQVLAGRADDLLMASIVGAIEPDGSFQSSKTDVFAHMAARTDAEATDALLSYSAGLDDRARAKNRYANVTASVALALLGLGSGVVASAVSIGWAAFFDGYPTTHELEELRLQRAKRLVGDNGTRWRWTIADASLEARLASSTEYPFAKLDVVVPGLGRQQVRIRRDNRRAGVRYLWQHPATSTWAEIPRPDTDEFVSLFAPDDDGLPVAHYAAVGKAERISENFRDGVIVSVDSRIDAIDAVEREVVRAVTQGDHRRIAGQIVRDAETDARWTDRWAGEGRPSD